MSKISNDMFPNIPWITKDGTFDILKYPLEFATRQSLIDDEEEFRGSVLLLSSFIHNGRKDAGIYLLGLMCYYSNDIYKLEIIADNLSGFKNKECADFLFKELERVESNNTNRRYINQIIKTLSFFPDELIEEKFYELSQNKKFSYRMRNKFKDIIMKPEFDYDDDHPIIVIMKK
jgi:hypothetical protein